MIGDDLIAGAMNWFPVPDNSAELTAEFNEFMLGCWVVL